MAQLITRGLESLWFTAAAKRKVQYLSILNQTTRNPCCGSITCLRATLQTTLPAWTKPSAARSSPSSREKKPKKNTKAETDSDSEAAKTYNRAAVRTTGLLMKRHHLWAKCRTTRARATTALASEMARAISANGVVHSASRKGTGRSLIINHSTWTDLWAIQSSLEIAIQASFHAVHLTTLMKTNRKIWAAKSRTTRRTISLKRRRGSPGAREKTTAPSRRRARSFWATTEY